MKEIHGNTIARMARVRCSATQNPTHSRRQECRAWLRPLRAWWKSSANQSNIIYHLETITASIIPSTTQLIMYRKIFFLTLLVCAFFVAPTKAQTNVLDEGFEGPTFPPAGWSVIDADGDGHCWQQGGTGLTRGSGDKIAVSYTVDGPTNVAYGAQRNYLVTPQIAITNNAFALSLTYIAEDLETDEHITVLVSTTGKNASDFTDVLYDATVSNPFGEEVEVNSLTRSLSAYQGKNIYIAILHTGTDTYALGIDDVKVINQKGPKRVTSFKVTAGGGQIPTAQLSWTNPTTNGNGEPLTSMDINIYRDGELIATLNNQQAGASAQYEDTGAPVGNHTYAIAVATAEGESQRLQRTLYIGEDIPGAVTNVAATVADGEATLSWSAPEQGKNKGWINTANLKYNILQFTNADTTLLAEGVTETSYKVKLADGQLTGFLVAAANAIGIGDTIRANSVIGFATTYKDIAVGADATADNRHSRLPIDLYYGQHSVSETIYYPEELKYATGTISHIVYKNHFRKETEVSRHVKIYVGETTNRDLSSSWIPAKDLQLSFDGNVQFHEEDNDVPIKLTTPYHYEGGNLVVMVVYDGTSSMLTYFDIFYVSSTDNHANRSRIYNQSAADNLDDLKTYNGSLVGEVPSTRFIMTTENMTALSGRITDSNGNGIAHAKLTVRLTNIETESNEDGYFKFDILPSGQTSIVIEAIGYESQTLNINLSGDAMTRDITLKALGKATISGSVVASDDNAKLAGATILIEGYAPFQTTTDGDGVFSIDGVYTGKSYNVVIEYPNYDIERLPITPSADTPLGTIVLKRSLIPAYDVNANNDAKANNIVVTWKAPDTRNGRVQHTKIGNSDIHTETSKDYTYSDYYVAHAWSAQDVRDSAMVGLSFKAVSAWLQATDGTFSACIWKGDKSEHTLLAEQNIPLSAISADGGWVTTTFDVPVEIRNGESYMVGIHIQNASGYPIGVYDNSREAISGRNNVKFSEQGYCYDGYYPYNISAYVGIPGTESTTDSTSSAPAPAYNVYRGQKNGASVSWTRLTAAPVEQTSFADNGWNNLVSGTYVYRVDAVYRDGVSLEAYSDSLVHELDYDAGVSAFVTPVKSNKVTTNATITVRIINYGEKTLTAIPVSYKLNDGTAVSKTYVGNLAKGNTVDVEIGDVSLPVQALSTITAWTALSEDENTTNDTLAINIPNYTDEIVGAFRWDAYSDAGPVRFHANTPEQLQFVREVTPDNALITAGTMLDNGYLAFTATWSGIPRQLMLMDTTTWTPLSSATTESYFLDMTADESTGKIYALSVGDVATDLATIDPSTFAITTIGSTGRDFHALASANGLLYAIDSNGTLCSIDPSTAVVSEIGTTGITDVRYLQSMVWMPKSKRMLWVQTGEESIGYLYQIDLSTGAATNLGQVIYDGYGSEMVGLYAVNGKEATSVNSIKDNTRGTYKTVYSATGIRSNQIGRGLNIVRSNDGSVRKIIKK